MISTPSLPNLFSISSIFFFVPAIFLLFPFWIVGMICACRAEKITGVKPKNWLFLVAFLFLSLIFYLTISDLARMGLQQLFPETGTAYYSYRYYSYDQQIKDISARMVIVLLGLPLLAFSWYQATKKADNDTQEKSNLLTRKYILTLESIILIAIILVSLGVCLYHIFNHLLGVTETIWQSLSSAFAYGGTAAIFLAFNWLNLKSTKKPL